MPSFTSVFTSLACLAAVASAVPAIPATKVVRQHHTDCPPNTSWYVCGNHQGCFMSDPCTGEDPSDPTPSPPTSNECSGEGQILPWAIYSIYPNEPDLSSGGSVNGVHVETYDNSSQVEQIVVYKDIPAEATQCGFGWAQGDRQTRTFVVKGGDALFSIHELTELPEDENDITFAAIEDHIGEQVAGIDMTNWDDLPARSHSGGFVDCADTLIFKYNLRNPEGNTKVFLGQDETNGLHLSYTC